MRRKVYVLNGPNLNMLGTREPDIYGTTTLGEIEERCKAVAAECGFDLVFAQSNFEGEIVTLIQKACSEKAAVIINPAGLSFFSVPTLDALKMIGEPVIEVHISNIHRRDPLYQKSIISTGATGVICGLGPYGYVAALLYLADFYTAR